MFTKIFKEKDYLVPNYYVFWDIKKLFALDILIQNRGVRKNFL